MTELIFTDPVNLLKAMIVILGFGHFIIAYLYGYRASRKKSHFLVFFLVLMGLVFYLFESSVRTGILLFFSSVLFTIHHAHDMYKIYSSKLQTAFWLLYGFIASYFIYQYALLGTHSDTVPIIMFWLMIFYHYLVWYWFYYKKLLGLQRKVYIQYVVGIHAFLFCLLFISYNSVIISFIFTYRFFHLQTIAHIIFSYYKYWDMMK